MLRPGGRFAVSDVIASPDMDEATRADLAAYTGCIAGALTEQEFRDGLAAAGFADVEIRETHRVHEFASSAIIRARKPAAPRFPPLLTPPKRSPHRPCPPSTSSTSPPKPRDRRSHHVELFEPAMCCQSRRLRPVRGPAAHRHPRGPALGAAPGRQGRRHNLSSDPDAFVANPKVTGLMAAFGEQALPALLIDGDIVMHGRYPTRDELAGLLVSQQSSPSSSRRRAPACYGPGGCC